MKRFSWPTVALLAGALLFLVATALYIAPSDQYILLPDSPRALAPLVQIQET